MFKPTAAEPIWLSHAPAIKAAPLAAIGMRAMPTADHFRRDHFSLPDIDIDAWRVTVVGVNGRQLRLSVKELARLPRASLAVVLECAGNRRREFKPNVDGIQWGLGAISEATWTGTRLSEVLRLVDVGTASHVVLEGADSGSVGDLNTCERFARAIPVEKALDADTLLVWEMNGRPLPAAHGAPLRVIVPGWYATDSVKWLASIRLESEEFRGHFEAVAYRLPNESSRGTQRMSTLPVNSAVTSHRNGSVTRAGWIDLHGIAWGSKSSVAAVEVSVDGLDWRAARLERSASPYGRLFWTLPWHARPGVHAIRVRAVDSNGKSQSEAVRWNPGGYANASTQLVHVAATT